MRAYRVGMDGLVGLVDADGLQDMYREIGCDCIDIARISVGGVPFLCVVDDVGLLAGHPITVWLSSAGAPLVGTVLVFGEGADRDLRSLTDQEARVLASNTQYIGNARIILAD